MCNEGVKNEKTQKKSKFAPNGGNIEDLIKSKKTIVLEEEI